MISKNNVVSNIYKRELGIVSSLCRYNFTLLKMLICQESANYLKTWECHSRCSIYYDCHKLYFDNYRTCYTIFGPSYIPHILYKLPAVPRTEKFEDGLCCHITPTELPAKNQQDFFPYHFLAVSAHNWLFQLHAKTGNVMQKVYLSRNYRFRSIGYESYGHTVVLISTLNINTNTRMRQDTNQRDVFCVLAFFQVFPLHYIGMMEIHKSIFGLDICNVAAMDGILLVSHQSGFVRLYSLHRIFADNIEFEAKLSEHCSHLPGVVGTHPDGLPVNIILKGQPSILFEVKCGDNDLQIGGFPWQYITQPIRNYNTFQVYTLDPPHTVCNGFLSYSMNHIEPDRAMFHPDDSGRIIHYSSTEMRFLRLNSSKCATTPVLETLFTLSLNQNQDWNTASVSSITRRRRSVKLTRHFDSIQEEFQHTLIAFHYEDDLDIMSLLLANPSGASCNTVTGRVHLYNNHTGKLLKIIQLNESWNEDSEHNLILDCDVLIHIVKNPRSLSTCYIYYLKSIVCQQL